LTILDPTVAMKISPFAGKPPALASLINVPQLITGYFAAAPDASVPTERVAFGTSGHRGSPASRSFNEAHILAITQAICLYRRQAGTDGPLFLGIDTHALSYPAGTTAVEVLAGNGVDVVIAEDDEYTPTPVISHAIITHNRGRTGGLADGIVVTPSHNPPQDGGFKYNATNGGPADTEATKWIENKANEILAAGLVDVKRLPLAQALAAGTTFRRDYIAPYVADLANVIDFDQIRGAKLRLGVDPLGGAGVNYWGRIADRYRLDLTVVNPAVDPTFRFLCVDWDGQIRMDPSSAYAMNGLIGMKDRFDLSFACDPDHDRHGIVSPSAGLMPPNHYLSAAIHYLFQHRPQWGAGAKVGKTVVSSDLIGRVAAQLGRPLYEVPVGFKWFSPGLFDGSLGFGGEESAGASFLRRDGTVWTTDKDGLIPCLLAAEMTAKTGSDPAALYRTITAQLGDPVADRVEAAATPAEKSALAKLSPDQFKSSQLAGEKIESILTTAPGNNAPIGGLKVVTASGWFAARPSGTENIYKIYGESFSGRDHLKRILEEAQALVSSTIATSH
jgi:phosphoglucomutase